MYHAGLKQNDFYILNPKKVTRVVQFILIHDIGLKWCKCYFFQSTFCSNELKWIKIFNSFQFILIHFCLLGVILFIQLVGRENWVVRSGTNVKSR